MVTRTDFNFLSSWTLFSQTVEFLLAGSVRIDWWPNFRSVKLSIRRGRRGRRGAGAGALA